MNKLKKVLTIWGIVYLLITALIYCLSEWLATQPIYVRTLVLSGVMVFGLQYLIFPILNKFLKL
ncbi:MAG: hypothetical protein ACPGJS_16050 [Flammeovirgaceae bacterium]